MFNPTNCEPMSVNGTISSVQSTLAPVSNRFQATNCAALGVQTDVQGLHLGAHQPNRRREPHGEALLPERRRPLDPRLGPGEHRQGQSRTAQAAALAADDAAEGVHRGRFNANPANCPAASRIGYAKATTPILPVPLTGPAFFVSNGGAKFPELIVVLQGDNVTVDLHGETFISQSRDHEHRRSRPSPTSRSVRFELVLPEGPSLRAGSQRQPLHLESSRCRPNSSRRATP